MSSAARRYSRDAPPGSGRNPAVEDHEVLRLGRGPVTNFPGKCKSANIVPIPARVEHWHAGARLIARLTAGKACRAGLMAESAIDPGV